MKRQNNLYDQIYLLNNLKLAFYKAQKRKKLISEVLLFKLNFDKNINDIQHKLITETYKPSKYRRFTIYEPKKRLICAATFTDRIVHHAIMNICENRFEKHLINHTCACRTNKGTDYALKIAQKFKSKWYLKLDIHKYFDSINHNIMLSHLNTLFKDKRLLNLFNIILKSYESKKDHGLPIGNLTSQYFANAFLSPLDHFIKEKLKCKEYVRYMDDFVLCSNSKNELKNWLYIIKNEVNKIDLKLNKPFINKIYHGFPFLGYRISYNNIRLKLNTRKRFTKKLKIANYKYTEGIWCFDKYKSHVMPLLANIKRAKYENFYKTVLNF